MKWVAALVVLVAACGDDNAHRNPPPGGSGGALGSGGAGGSGGSGGSSTDAAPVIVDGTVACISHVNLAPCNLAFGGTVEISGGASAPVDNTGAFQLDASGLLQATIEYSGVTSSMEPAVVVTPVPGSVTLRTIASSLLTAFYTQDLFPQQYNGDGWVMAFAVNANGGPLSGVKVMNAPLNQDVWYDDLQGNDLIVRAPTDIATGPAGLAVFPNVNPSTGPLQFDFIPATGVAVHVSVEVLVDHLTVIVVPVQ